MSASSNPVYERIALATAIYSEDGFRDVMEGLRPEWLTEPAHRLIFDVLLAKQTAGESGIKSAVLARELEAGGNLATAGGVRFLSELLNDNAPVAQLPSILKDLRMTWVSRTTASLLESATEQLKYAGGDGTEMQQLLAKLSGDFDNLNSHAAPEDYTNLDAVLNKAYQEITNPQQTEMFPTGYRDIDEKMGGGMRGGQMVVIAARPATGKSVAALNILSHLAIDRGVPVAFFSREMSGSELAVRLLASRANIALDVLNSRRLSDGDKERLINKIKEIMAADLFVDDSTDSDIAEIIAKAKQMHRRHGVRVIAIDYIQLVNCLAVTKRGGGRQEEMAEVSKLTKRLALATGLVIIAVAQLNRGSEQRADKRPQTSDLRESGQLEQDADTVILLHREDMHNPETERAGEVDFIISKHRNGPTGTVPLAFMGHFSKIADMYHEEPRQAA